MGTSGFVEYTIMNPTLSPKRYTPTQAEVDALIARARGHELGVEFLKEGALDSVAAVFGAHAFVILKARQQLG